MQLRARTAGAAILTSLVLASSAHAAAVPLPDADPFYAVPSSLAGLPNGAILDSRQVTATWLSVPLPATSWQVKYKTIDVHGRPSADVATVMVPLAPWLSGPRPLVSYQTAEDGAASKCAPSYGLRAGLAAGGTNSSAEAGLMLLALLRGWAVVVPDYEGPRSEFLGALGEGRGVLDGIRAALHFPPARLSATAPLGMWGYSGGAFASSIAGQMQPDYAPELRISGIALGGVVADLMATIRAFSGSPFGGALAMGIAAVDRSYPEADLLQYLNATGKAAVAASEDDCINDAVVKHPFARIEDYEAYPGAISSPAVQDLIHRISPLGIAGTPRAPVYDYHAVLDELAPIGPDRLLVNRYCAAGVKVQHYEDLLSEHVSLTITGAPGAVAYLGARFAGIPAPSNCG